MRYTSKEQLIIEYKKLLLEKQISQKEVAKKLNLLPQALTKILNKQNFSFDDMSKLLSAIGYNIEIQFTPSKAPEPSDPPEPASTVQAPKRSLNNIRAFTPEAAAKVDLKRLVSDIGYQFDIKDAFGNDILVDLMSKARQQEAEQQQAQQ
ncbi:helix-turn-helix transcriptional regulator [Lacrimispora sp.]|uniref:helix-turn-helix transcriptional regulator n=1 Tax=Lacrimispora sp. TaxID=2719234 RepID=UPI0028AA70AD|nr:helix-turn-helix transcriptional regulator [Lacrimispora sp.]